MEDGDMKKTKFVMLVALLIAATFIATSAFALIYPKGYTPKEQDVYGQVIKDRIPLNDGPGTKRYFKELGTYNTGSDWLKIVAKAWDPNNGIWWVKVECPRGTEHYGWTGYKRFYASSFDLNDVPTESWYESN